MSESMNPRTVAAANGIAAEDTFGAVTPPICLSSTFTWPGFGRTGTHDYMRSRIPTRWVLGGAVAKLEGGAGGVVVSWGMAAIGLVLSQLSRDDVVVVPHDCYGGTDRVLLNRRDRGHFKVAFV